ncbi:leukotoxin LktA family filamentous adhesin [Alkalilimnicola ehrlichii]|uniref:Filamentous haemagglutinin FhaB/tRNA nuclease CdiA-like TPS domain-containing protein n=1 Tax=Alkalilimnicola ehrlichii TaxID=351052 RepID=A0A3E0WSW5_9GAMM|nr:leukotoxin LktA family filamentous adhesin [Alkalilimnicola ehrlichii]RFA35085.1 hypothetical protein CAL65_13310 [Alkalilimnicola ehrlichii]
MNNKQIGSSQQRIHGRFHHTGGARFRLHPTKAAILSAIAATTAPVGVWAGPGQTELVTDGRTNTSVDQNGNRFRVETGTVRGSSGFNSFEAFRVAAGDTVDLHLPEHTLRLINLVHGSQSEIYGVVNSLKGGQIGGDVIFANPHGIVVGQSGVLNVGSLMLTTPSHDFMDQMLDRFQGGQVTDEAPFEQLLLGAAPLAEGAEVRVDGNINALGAIRLSSVDVRIAGQLHAATPETQGTLFEASVNTEGLEHADFAAVEEGSIVIGARHSITVDENAELHSVANSRGEQGDIRLVARAEQETPFGIADANARVSIAGSLKGRDIDVRAETRARVDMELPDVDEASLADLLGMGDSFLAELGEEAAELLLGDASDIWKSGAFVTADAEVDILNGASLEASGDVRLSAEATREINLVGQWNELEGIGLSVSAAYLGGDTRVQAHEAPASTRRRF